MEASKAHEVMINLCNPTEWKERIWVTSRGKKFLALLFEGKYIDVIDFHSIILRIAYTSGWFQDKEKYINLKDIVVYLLGSSLTCITVADIKKVANEFKLEHDNEYFEVEDMRRIIDNI